MWLVAIAAVLVAIATSGCTPAKSEDTVLVTEVPPFTLPTNAPAPPMGASKYKRQLTSAAHFVWGLDAPIAAFAAQVHQESGWNETATSPVGAQGLAQFMPSTANWIDDVYPAELGPAQPMDPSWALKALVRYDKHLWDRIEAKGDCSRFAFTLRGYNGGLGWVYRDQAKAKDMGLDSQVYWDSVENVNSGRNAAAFAENKGYPSRIVKVLQSRYSTWGPMVCSG